MKIWILFKIIIYGLALGSCNYDSWTFLPPAWCNHNVYMGVSLISHGA